jgi:hypothetical protein
MISLNWRKFISQIAIIAGGHSLGLSSCNDVTKEVLDEVRSFLKSVANPDGSFRPGIDPGYQGTSDIGLSGIPAYAYSTLPGG